MLKYVPWVLAIAVVTAVIYAWGLYRGQNQSRDLMAQLYDKCSAKVMKALKQQGVITKKEIEALIDNTTASLFYSKNRVKVEKPKAFAADLIKRMEEHNLIKQGDKAGSYVLYHDQRKKR